MTARKLLLVDGSSYLYRAFHALPPLTNSKGEPTGAVLGVLNMLNKLIKEESPDRVAVVFDAPAARSATNCSISTRRIAPPMPDELRSQVQPLLDAVEALGLAAAARRRRRGGRCDRHAGDAGAREPDSTC